MRESAVVVRRLYLIPVILGVEWKNELEIWRQKIFVFAVFEKYSKAKKFVNILDF